MVYFRHLRLSAELGWVVRNSDKAKRDAKGMARYLTTPDLPHPESCQEATPESQETEIRLS